MFASVFATWELKERSDGDGNGYPKRQYVQIGKTTTLHVNHALCTFLAVTARLPTFYEAREHMKTIFFVIFQNQDTVLQNQLQKHFTNISQMK